MIQGAIGGLILLLIYKFLDKNKANELEPKVDWWMALLFIWIPGVLISISFAILALFELPTWPSLFGYLLYFLVPFLMLFRWLDYQLNRAVKYALWVPLIAIITEIPIVMLSGSGN